MKYSKLIKITSIVIACLAFLLLAKCSGNLKEENRRLSNNQAVLLDSIQQYKVADSLNGAKINALELSVSDYKRYRAEDAELIKKLKAGKHVSTTTTNTTTTNQIKVLIRDTIIRHDTIALQDTIKQICYDSKWLTVSGFLIGDTVDLKIVNREELLITESLVKKKFLFIKLPVRLFGYKTKRVDAISKNPNTEITNLEFIQIYD